MKLTRCASIALVLILIVLLAVPTWGLGTTRVGSRSTYNSAATTGTGYLYYANSLTSGNIFQYSSTGTVTGTFLSMVSNTLTSGTFIQLTADNDILNGGYYIKCIGGTDHATTVYTIGENGAVTAVGGDFQINSTGTTKKFKVAAATGNTEVVGTLAVTGASTLTGAVTASSTIAQSVTNAAGGSANPYDYTSTLGLMDGSDDFTLFDVNVTNADHTGSTNTVQVMDVANITGDVHATETAIKIGTGWDAGINTGSPITCASTISGLRLVSADEGDASTTLTVAAYPSGSIITSSAATAEIVLPAVATSTGVWYTFVTKGATQWQLSGATACVLCDGQTAAKTHLVWSTTPLYLSVSVVCDGTNWMVSSMTVAPDSSS